MNKIKNFFRRNKYPKRFTMKEVDDLKAVFELMDTDRNGCLSIPELEKATHVTGHRWDQELWQIKLEMSGFSSLVTRGAGIDMTDQMVNELMNKETLNFRCQ
ncbi:hypothetical protein HELRODRAFT_179376 [Helobdella robusta]|uniref:EF-hand domain-containing protein n=1 Tax=Helobdella robusta TaxID=6412 RepID=T1FEM5_HELRO|nr:hypothetical protein HELRODRAFT_179376 [Helobdella robusta]ESN95599.1 hypothetical protein HELRODRAFT_179376 [Helobdella robusta]